MSTAASAPRTTCSPRIGAGWFPSSAEQILGWLFSPVAWLIGIPWHDCPTIANLLGLRMVTNELVAFQRLGPMQATLDPRTYTIATFALCGFANFSSIGIQIGGIGALAPNKRTELAQLGLRAMLAGTMANLMSASHCRDHAAMSAARTSRTRGGDFARSQRAAKYILSKSKLRPKIARRARLRLRRICRRVGQPPPAFPTTKSPASRKPTAEGHAGQLVIGKVRHIPVAVMQGRVHFYEGYSAKEVVYPMRVFRQLGIQAAILTNAAGAINLSFKPGRPGRHSRSHQPA